MYYDRITRRVHLEIGGEEYLLAFTLNGLAELETLAGDSVMNLAGKGEIPPLHVLNSAFFIALRDGGNDHRYKKAEAMELAQKFLDEREDGIVALAEVFFVTLAVSGLMGKDFHDKILKEFSIDNKDPERKNAGKAEVK